MAVSSYSTTPANNTTINGINIAEGCPPGNINDAIRQMMADTRGFWDVSLRTSGNFTVTGTVTFNTAPAFGAGVAAATRTALGLGTAATASTGDFVGASRSVTGGGLASGGGDLSADRVITVTAASEAEATTGTANDRTMTPLRTAQAIAGDRVARRYTSSEQSVASSVDVSHGLGGAPFAYSAVLRCVTAEHGYVAGDEIPVTSVQDAPGVYAYNVFANATTLGFRSTSTSLRIRDKAASTIQTITAGNWRLVFRAEL